MSTTPQSSEDKLRELDKALGGLERKDVLPGRGEPKPKQSVELGPKTKLAVRIMAWAIGLFWVLWLVLALVVSPPRQLTDLLVVPFSALVCSLIFQLHRMLLIGFVRKNAASR